MVLSQISNKFHRLQQITKQEKLNVQLRQTRKNDYDILIFLDIHVFFFCVHIYIYIYIYIYILFCDCKYPIFRKYTLQSLHEHKSGFQVLIESLSFI